MIKSLELTRNLKLLLLTFCLVVLAVSVYLSCFNGGSLEHDSSKRTERTSVSNNSKIDNEQENLEKDPSGSNAAIRVKSSTEFDIAPNQSMIVFFTLKVMSAPSFDKRIKFITKYNGSDAPYVGWAIGLRRLVSSTRFEIYLQDQNNQGGWIPLAPIEMKLNANYFFAFTIKPGDFVSGMVFEADEDGKKLKGAPVVNLGGVPIPKLTDFSNDSSLQITSGKLQIYKFNSNIKNVTIFKVDDLPSRQQLEKLVVSGLPNIFSSFKNTCVYSLSEKKEDCILK